MPNASTKLIKKNLAPSTSNEFVVYRIMQNNVFGYLNERIYNKDNDLLSIILCDFALDRFFWSIEEVVNIYKRKV